MLKPKVFFNLVEIQTKIASLFPFLIGLLFTMAYYGQVNWQTTALFFGAMLIFDMTTTGINNLIDYLKSTDTHFKTNHNIIGTAGLSTKRVALLLIAMLLTATALGLWLVALTDVVVLFIGTVCFFIGVFYTYGPLPLSRLPLGEVFSGLTMGLGILFLVVYVNMYHPDTTLFVNEVSEWVSHPLITMDWLAGGLLVISLDLMALALITLVALPCVFTIANIMLANNLCDLAQDIKNNRYTLPYFIGKPMAIKLFGGLYVAVYVAVLLAFALGVYTWGMLAVVLASAWPVYQNTKQFVAKQAKAQTFVVSIKNMILINTSMALAFLLDIFYPYLLRLIGL